MSELRGSFEEAFDELWARSYQLGYRLLGSREAAEDVAAEAMARAWLHWRKVAALPWRDGWVLRVVTNLATDTLRRRRRFLPGRAAPDVAEEVVLRRALVEALALLPRRQREVVALRHLCDLSEADAAAALGLRPGTVGVHLHRGLAALKEHLGPDNPDDGVSHAVPA